MSALAAPYNDYGPLRPSRRHPNRNYFTVEPKKFAESRIGNKKARYVRALQFLETPSLSRSPHKAFTLE